MSETRADQPPRPWGKRADATRAAILAAAREAFTHRRYEAVGVREIAAAAGVDPALVIRYFGSKEELFTTAVAVSLDFSEIFTVDRAELGLRLATFVLHKPVAGPGFDPLLALLRSAPGGEAGRLLRQALDEEFIAVLAARLGPPDGEVRASLIGAVLIGVMVSRSLIRTEPLTTGDPAQLIPTLGRLLQNLVDGPPPAPGDPPAQ